MAKIIIKLPRSLSYEYGTNMFNDTVTPTDALRYLKGIFTNKERLISNYINVIKKCRGLEDLCQFLTDNYDSVEQYSYAEAFKIDNQAWRAIVFGSINIRDMIESLGHKRLAVEGVKVSRKQYNDEGEVTHLKEYDNIYETYEVDCTGLGLTEKGYVVKVWCTSTEKEHWLWIKPEFKDKPLEAIASTFIIHKNLIPYISELKRQGDIMLVELKEDVTPEGELVPLTSEQYFGLLTSES